MPDRKLMGIMLKVFSESLAHELCSEHTELLHCAMETFQMVLSPPYGTLTHMALA